MRPAFELAQVIERFGSHFADQHQPNGYILRTLHTWGQNLSLHPHIHCIVPGGGIDWKGQWKSVSASENGKVFLFPVKALSPVFRGKLSSRLRQDYPLHIDRIKAA